MEEALKHFQIASSLQPGNVDVLLNLALAERSTKRIEDAVKTLRQAARTAPNNPEVMYALAKTLEELGDVRGARQALRRAYLLKGQQK